MKAVHKLPFYLAPKRAILYTYSQCKPEKACRLGAVAGVGDPGGDGDRAARMGEDELSKSRVQKTPADKR